MTAICFVDTNVLVYFRDSTEKEKQPLAKAWLQELWANRLGRISVQVLNEYYVTVTRKLSIGMSRKKARQDIQNLFAWNPLPLDTTLMTAAWQAQDRYKFSLWDAMIVAAAQISSCNILLSEDLQDGQTLQGLRIVNPFLHTPNSILHT